MALSGKKIRTLDAICAKLKLTNQDPPEENVRESQDVPNNRPFSKNSIAEAELPNSTALPAKGEITSNDEKENEVLTPLTKLKGSLEGSPEKILDCNANNKEMVETPKPSPKTNGTTADSSSRRKRRKNLTPRNITQVREFYDKYDSIDEKDELAEYEINNQNTKFPPEDEDHDEYDKEESSSGVSSLHSSAEFMDSKLDLSLANHSTDFKHHSTNHSKKDKHSQNMCKSSGPGSPLDLSQASKDHSQSNLSGNGYLSEEAEDLSPRKADKKPQESASAHSKSVPCSPGNDSKQSITAGVLTSKDKESDKPQVELKDYAENMMNKLISMYGFGAQERKGVSKSVPARNFNTLFQDAPTQVKGQAAAVDKMEERKFIPASIQNPLIGPNVNIAPKTLMPGIYANFVERDPKAAKVSSASDGHLVGSPQVYIPASHPGGTTPTSAVSVPPQQAGPKLSPDKYSSNIAYVKSLYRNSPLQQRVPGQDTTLARGTKALLPENNKYLKRYSNGNDCGGEHCQEAGYKDHYHCLDCSFQVFIKKEEMVRHFKWHRKREESLQHGFLRFSPLDNCVEKFGACTHNGRQTHYHCLQAGCDKVYISTSDVQMHANYHRKDSAIIQEGFQRFRATEDCGTLSCAFYGQRTTHFHCRRSNCNFTFKNKADMEKHKSYHQKDEVLSRDGFKKFMKYEHCMYPHCKYSKLSNHIHCIREGCHYVLHSTAQLYSHKRKHERRDFENAYRKYREHTSIPSPASAIPASGFTTITSVKQYGGNTVIQSIPVISPGSTTSPGTLQLGVKRQAEQMEPEELKKAKLEPSTPTSVSSASGFSDSGMDIESPYGTSTPIMEPRIKVEPGLNMESDITAEADIKEEPESEPESPVIENDIDESMSYMSEQPSVDDEDDSEISGDKLNDSLSLPIPKYKKEEESMPEVKSEPGSETKSEPESSFDKSLVTSPQQHPSPQQLILSPTLNTASTALVPPRSIYSERRERDDSWKTYLVRYTANDPCNPRCQYLYKDHYHCKIEGCLVLFKSKDGVREHARFHELQDRITPIAYRSYDAETSCPEKCQYSLKDQHYHCIWSGCSHVVPHVGPTFGRLEHYRVHEYARAAAGKAYNRPMVKGDDGTIRRRGRPPKYPKDHIPRIPKVNLSEEEIKKSAVTLRDGEVLVNVQVINGFRLFTPEDPCPDELCIYAAKQHYHCGRPRCYTATDRIDVLNLHAKDFHSFVKILPGFEFFDRNVCCRRPQCPNNKTNRHFHCTRPKCDYSFVRHSTMPQHDKKHTSIQPVKLPITVPQVSSIPSCTKVETTLTGNFVPIVPAMPSSSAPMIKAAGTFIPINTINQAVSIPTIIAGGGVTPAVTAVVPQTFNPSTSQMSLAISPIQALPANITNTQLISGITTVQAPGGATATVPLNMNTINTAVPLTVLLQQKGNNVIPPPSWPTLRNKMHYAILENCGRPFCKLKKKDHYHCFDCNQAFSDPARLRSHVGKHGIKFKRTEIEPKVGNPGTPITIAPRPAVPAALNMSTDTSPEMDPEVQEWAGADLSDEDEEDKDELNKSSSLNLNPSTFSSMIAKAQEENRFSSDEGQSSSTKLSGDEGQSQNLSSQGHTVSSHSLNSSTSHMDQSNQSEKSLDLSNGDIDMEDSFDSCSQGPLQIDLKEEKSVSKWSGRQLKSTMHEDFVDSNAINVHVKQQRRTTSPRGVRDDSVPDGYVKFRYNEDCFYNKCTYRQSVTHFHCLREDCKYGFSDRSRLVQHSLRHERIDSITGGEMQQYRINQDCGHPLCENNNKMSHFHCLKCDYSCIDSSKVLTHRKYHNKVDMITAQGFAKTAVTDDCGVNFCQYKKKQTHYHCQFENCNYAVLGPAQMGAHKLKHQT